MKRCYCFLTLLIVVFAFDSCSNELDVTADYVEAASIYGLLDPSQPIQYIKINKVFSNPDASAGNIAKNPDSLFFDTLAPTLTEIGTGRGPIFLYKTDELHKASGYFASAPNYLYATKEKLSSKYAYRLELRLPQSQTLLTSVTNIPDSVRLSSPVTVTATPSLIEIPLNGKVVISFNSTVKSKIFDGYFFFNYLEVNKADTNIKVNKTVQWRLFTKLKADNDQVSQLFTLRISSTSFYDLILLKIPVDVTVERRFLPCKMELTAGNLELDNYIEATEPSIGIVQKQTEYTNITNGIGIFASRRVSAYSNIGIGKTTKLTISTGNDFKQLGFVYP